MYDLQKVKNYIESLPSEARPRAMREFLKRYYPTNLFDFSQKCLNYKDMNHVTHGAMVSALESDTKRKLIIMPRGTFKSSIGVVAYSIWCLIRNPNERILIDSQIYTNSKNFLREIKAHMESERLTAIFGQFKTDKNWTEGEITIAQRTQVFKEASITAGGVGTVKVGQHYDRIIIDDYNSDKNSSTMDGCDKVINHYRMNTSILEPDGTVVVIATRYSERDLPGFILKNEIGIDYIPWTK